MTDLNCREVPTCDPGDSRVETAKGILENMDAILKELFNQLRMIDDAIYSPQNTRSGENSNEPKQEGLLEILDRQRNYAESLMYLAVHIREGLW